MAKVGPQRAADLTGRSKSTIQRAMKAGKLSYEVDNAGRRVIDVSELERVFGLAPQPAEPQHSPDVEAELEKATALLETERLKMRVRMLEEQLDGAREQIDDLKDQRDQWQKQAQQVLLTSQYSQKQAEELKAELQIERDRRVQMRRMMEGKKPAPANAARPAPAQADKKPAGIPVPEEKKTPTPFERHRMAALQAARGIRIRSLWKKIKGTPATPNKSSAPTDGQQKTGT